jgi:hypothetical protein
MEIKPHYYNLILSNQLTGKEHEDPHSFLETFYDYGATMGLDENRVQDAYMKLFHLALIGDAKECLKTLPSQSVRTWAEVEAAFLKRFFPPAKMIQVQSEITAFKQGKDETFYEAWERFQRLLRKCPNQRLTDLAMLNIFCTGLNHEWTIHLTAIARKLIDDVDVPTAMEIITSMVASDRAKHQPRSQLLKPKRVLEFSTSDAILAQNKLMTQQIELLSKAVSQHVPKPQLAQVIASTSQSSQVVCDLCGDNHPYNQCPHAGY